MNSDCLILNYLSDRLPAWPRRRPFPIIDISLPDYGKSHSTHHRHVARLSASRLCPPHSTSPIALHALPAHHHIQTASLAFPSLGSPAWNHRRREPTIICAGLGGARSHTDGRRSCNSTATAGRQAGFSPTSTRSEAPAWGTEGEKSTAKKMGCACGNARIRRRIKGGRLEVRADGYEAETRNNHSLTAQQNQWPRETDHAFYVIIAQPRNPAIQAPASLSCACSLKISFSPSLFSHSPK